MDSVPGHCQLYTQSSKHLKTISMCGDCGCCLFMVE